MSLHDVLQKLFLAHFSNIIIIALKEEECIVSQLDNRKASLKLRFNFFSIQIRNLIYRLSWFSVGISLCRRMRIGKIGILKLENRGNVLPHKIQDFVV